MQHDGLRQRGTEGVAKRGVGGQDAVVGSGSSNSPSFAATFQRTMWAVVFLSAATYGLYDVEFVNVLLADQRVDRPALNLGVAICSAILACAAYLDVYRGEIMGERIDYEHCR